jgi:hypothetical protein
MAIYLLFPVPPPAAKWAKARLPRFSLLVMSNAEYD